jgi:hypothetical protein
MADPTCGEPGPRIKNILGLPFGRLTVQAFAGLDRRGKALWTCSCECGGEITTAVQSLKRGRTRSCGCLQREVTAARTVACFTKHGETSNGRRSAEYRAWCSMKTRCYNSSVESWDDYGRRGIQVCKRWRDSFENFLADMGRRPSPRHSIERKDNDGNYEPGNCVWATRTVQARNTRSTKLTEEIAATIRRLRAAEGFPYAELGRMFDVHWSTARDIVIGDTWRLD